MANRAQHSVSLAMLTTVAMLAFSQDWLTDMKDWIQKRTQSGGASSTGLGDTQSGRGQSGINPAPGQAPPNTGQGAGGGGGGSF